jgi:hypothetical protein
MNTKTITRTALMLALTIVFQILGRYIPLGPNSNFIVGPLVNACLIITASLVGVFGASLIAIVAPFGALLTGATVPLPFLPFVALGNLVLVVLFYLINKKNYTAGVVAGAVVKFLALYASIIVFTNMANIPAKKATAMIFTFGWPQLVTALIGGVIAYFVIRLTTGEAKKDSAYSE